MLALDYYWFGTAAGIIAGTRIAASTARAVVSVPVLWAPAAVRCIWVVLPPFLSALPRVSAVLP